MSQPIKNTAFTLYFTLYKSDGTVIANPGTYTRATSIDGAAVDTSPNNTVTEEDTTYGQLSWLLDAAEMNGDAIWIFCKDDTSGCVPFTCTIYPRAAATVAVGSIANDAITAAAIAAGAIDLATFAADCKTGSALKANVETITAAAITAAAIATDAIDADALKADAVTEIQSGLATSAALTTVAGYIDTEVASILAAVDTEIATIVAELAKVPKSDATVSWNATALAAIGLAVLNQALATSDADALNARTVRSALRVLRNKVDVVNGKVKKEDDTADAWAFAVTTDAAADPITVIDPT